MQRFHILYEDIKQFSALVEWFDYATLLVFPTLESPVLALGNELLAGDIPKETMGRWLFGAISYDFKNKIDTTLESHNFDAVFFPETCFFEPEVLIFFHSSSEAEICTKGLSNEDERIINNLIFSFSPQQEYSSELITLYPREHKKQYLDKIAQIQKYIQKGDFYEINYCTEFFAEDIKISPFYFFIDFYRFSKNPFSAYFKAKDKHVICVSPERFIKKTKNKLVSQPIKGTIKRGINREEDERLKNILKISKKDRVENVMIVDLVRNDLSKIAQRGSVKVEELFGVYSFDTVHQMISTVSCTIKENITFQDIIRATFPMGSMTGAPKRKVMQTIEELEETKRGIYSGTIGYIRPDGDFDFNVVIRTLVYNDSSKYLSYMTGGAITHLSKPEEEYQECLVKASAVKSFLHSYGIAKES